MTTVLPRDNNQTPIQAFSPKGGFDIVAGTVYTINDFDSGIIYIPIPTNLTMSDGKAVAYFGGIVLAIKDNETYQFNNSFVAGLA